MPSDETPKALRPDPDWMICWRQLITTEMEDKGEGWADVEHCSLSPAELDEPFEFSYGALNLNSPIGGGRPFGLWTHHRVYFPVSYDGAVAVASVPRSPNAPITHVGEQEVRQAILIRSAELYQSGHRYIGEADEPTPEKLGF